MFSPLYDLTPNALQITGWVIQLAIIVGLIARRDRAALVETRSPDLMPSLAACACAVFAAWAWRLGESLVALASGFHYLVGDDAARFLMAWGWSRNPYFVTWDGVWLGGSFYAHGLAMVIAHDPLAGSRTVAAFSGLLALAGLFTFAQGALHDRRVSILTVLLAAPWWPHVLLGTGTMPEVPLMGLFLGGAGLLLLALRGAGRRRKALLWASGLCFSAATAFHMVAWFFLAAVLLVLLLVVVIGRRQERGEGLGIAAWAGFATVSTSYCVLWLAGCWVKFGDPFGPMKFAGTNLLRDVGILPLHVRVLEYPRTLAYTVLGLVPLLVFGIIGASSRMGAQRTWARAVLGSVGLGLLTLIAVAMASNPASPAYKETLTLAAALLPFAAVPIASTFRALPNGTRVSRSYLALACLSALAMAVWAGENHRQVMAYPARTDCTDPGAIAMATWLRSDITFSSGSTVASTPLPVRVWTDSLDLNLTIAYVSGFPGRLELLPPATTDPGASSLSPGQYLLTNRSVAHHRLVKCGSVAGFTLYRAWDAEIPSAPSVLGAEASKAP